MQSLQELLSPLIKDDRVLMDKIKQQKLDVIRKYIDPSAVKEVRPEIVESWIRSSENGLDPRHYDYPPQMDPLMFDQLLKKKALLIQASTPFIHHLENMLSHVECYIIISDEQGVILSVVKALGGNGFKLEAGTIWTEKTIGTCSHGMCILLKSPIQLCGPEHFSHIFENIACSSAPIFDENGNLEGTLTITSPNLHSHNSQTLGLAISMAMGIQKQFQIALQNEIFDAALANTEEIMLFSDDDGKIIRTNMNALKIIELFGRDLIGSQVEDVLGEQPFFKSVAETGNTLSHIDFQLKNAKKKLFLTSIKPIKSKDKISGYIVLLKETDHIKKAAKSPYAAMVKFTFDTIIGSSPQSMKLKSMAKKFAHFNSNILIQGESGTGKDVYAQAIHFENRPNGPYIAVNCAAIPQNLIASELFGYEGGAFTGAERQGKPGKIELANGGTLFLDEIGDMPLELQAVLLRVLEDKMIMHVGGSRYIPVDFRLITATNKNLLDLVKNNQFREDLYYRISVFKLSVPPLRERGSDIVQLIEHFIRIYSSNQGIDEPILSNSAKYLLLQYNWPGNVRQLQNTISYAVCMSNEGIIRPENLPEEILSYQPPSGLTLAQPEPEPSPNEIILDNTPSMKEIEKKAIMKALHESNNHIRGAAKILGLSKSTLYRKIKEYEIS
ncbi:sigma-54-dependent Fis family transcriptional regulator [Desulfitobacterium hafniense]|uniref:sigma-54-dependent Fis family transcriptional regulator n=1 Tax=Desulfitobacterium hafniense TaxID=49338 RepID=UPI000362740E|nr:sigma-54-dependent Fis family transcriptional regulator [Desulfitobacterium hafniense]